MSTGRSSVEHLTTYVSLCVSRYRRREPRTPSPQVDGPFAVLVRGGVPLSNAAEARVFENVGSDVAECYCRWWKGSLPFDCYVCCYELGRVVVIVCQKLGNVGPWGGGKFSGLGSLGSS